MPDIEYLFRYRDLSADTLPEHRAVIEEHGSCWWGWWKRPSETGRPDVWQAMQAELGAHPHVLVGLFDSGSGQVHSATVTEIIAPEVDDHGQVVPVTPGADEAELIPAYYRDSRHSRGWMRITSISYDPISFDGEYSYRRPPPLAQHSASQLQRLEGKKVASSSELRAMDTTIWEIRPSQPDDPEGEFQAATPPPPPALLSQPIECHGEWVLHLTDLHYAVGAHRGQHRWRLEDEDEARPTLSDAVSQALLEAGRSVGAVVVSGDLTFTAAKEEFEAAERGLRKLLDGHLSLTTDHLLVVPGNHDIAWTAAGTYDAGAPVAVAPAAATSGYRAFFRQLYNVDADGHLAMARRLCMPGGNLIDIVGVNSSSLEQGQSFLAGMGRVQEHGFGAAAGSLRWDRPGSAVRVLVLHHHLALTEDLESPDEYATGFGIAIDATRTLRLAAARGVSLAIHGHKHRAFIWRSDVYRPPEQATDTIDPGSVNIVGGGSAGSTSTDGPNSFFNLIRLRSGWLELEMYRSSNAGAFEVFRGFRAAVTSTGKAHTLGRWEVVDAPFAA